MPITCPEMVYSIAQGSMEEIQHGEFSLLRSIVVTIHAENCDNSDYNVCMRELCTYGKLV